MKLTHKRLAEYARKEGITPSVNWTEERPHFGGVAPHRYQAFAHEYIGGKSCERVCVYCLRPETFKAEGK